MVVKKMVLHCNCNVTMCPHAKEEVGDMLQDTYDDGYDEGWNDAFISVKQTLVEMGFEKASRMSTPPPPQKNKGRDTLRSPGKSSGDLVH
jgi:hypothetical protein